MTENEQLLQNLINDCSEETARNYFRRKNSAFVREHGEIDNPDPEKFSNVRKFGALKFEADDVVFAFADVKTDLTERSCRKAQFDVARKILRDENADAGIFIFKGANGAFRLSLVHITYKGTQTELNPFRRFTYYVVPGGKGNATFKRQVGKCPFDSLEAIKDSFALEPVNKEFYSRIQKHFYKLIGGKVDDRNDFQGCMSLPSRPIARKENHKAYSEFAVRLLGRVVFCWFLKHKRCDKNRPLIPEKVLSVAAVEANQGYYHKVLEKLFFQTLNKPINERSEFAPEGAHLVPYLNGGLFDPHHDDFYEEGAMGESKFIGSLLIPNEWFRDLFETLEMYNFTIDENTSLDTDVSIDPEILGRIFENLLAEINPETGDSARKATGSFYTPREIVDYMVEESLLQHLKTALGIATKNTNSHEKEDGGSPASANDGRDGSPSRSDYGAPGGHALPEIEQKLRALFVDDDQPHNIDDKTRRAVVDAFRTIKVLDPACGSGAFPVGILQKMLCALRKVDPENDLWLDAQIEQIHSMKLSKQEENRRLDEIDHAFKTNEADYGRKLGIIQNSVYGVDIQPIAIEISKLRFFLTLVVDEKINDKEDNRGILPLPNLDFKFVCANTLIPAPEIENNSGELDLDYYPDFFDDFTALTEQYFYAGTPAEKQTIREQLSDCVGKKIHGELDKVHSLQGEDLFELHGLSKAKQKKIKERRAELVRNISLWESYKNIFTGQPVGFFDPKYMFPDASEGFDVVIANPPYVRQEDIKEQKPAFSEVYDCYKGTADLLVYFYEKGCRLLKENGVLTYITSNKYFRAGYGDKLRGYLAGTMRIHQLIDFGDAPVFDATAYPSIIVMSKGRDGSPSRPDSGAPGGRALPENDFLALNWSPGDPVSAFVRIFQERAFPMKQGYLTADGWSLEHPRIFELMQKLRNVGTPLGEYVDRKFYYGIKTGYNEAFVIDRLTRDRLIAEDPNCESIIKPFLRGRDVKRWRTNPQDLWLINTHNGYGDTPAIDIDDYPVLKRYLDEVERKRAAGEFGEKAKNAKGLFKRDDQGKTPYNLRNCVYVPEFEKPKIIYPDIYEHQSFAFDRDGYFAVNTTYFIPTDECWLTGVLNTKAVEWFYGQVSNRVRGGYLRAFSDYMKQIPIPAATSQQQEEIEDRVERILAAKKENPEADVSALETEIDQLVYQLYNLTPEEIAIVEGRS